MEADWLFDDFTDCIAVFNPPSQKPSVALGLQSLCRPSSISFGPFAPRGVGNFYTGWFLTVIIKKSQFRDDSKLFYTPRSRLSRQIGATLDVLRPVRYVCSPFDVLKILNIHTGASFVKLENTTAWWNFRVYKISDTSYFLLKSRFRRRIKWVILWATCKLSNRTNFHQTTEDAGNFVIRWKTSSLILPVQKRVAANQATEIFMAAAIMTPFTSILPFFYNIFG